MIDPYSPASNLSKREHLIYMVLQGLLSNPVYVDNLIEDDVIIQRAINIADNLITTLNLPEQVPVFGDPTAAQSEG